MDQRAPDFKVIFALILALLLESVAAPTIQAQLAAKTSPKAATARRDIVGTEKKFYSRGQEELIIRDFFQDRRNGVFLDVGCWQPIEASNTYYLEHELGWTGVAIDALAELAPRWKRVRPSSLFLNFLVADRVGPPGAVLPRGVHRHFIHGKAEDGTRRKTYCVDRSAGCHNYAFQGPR